jgi:tRNA U34 5-methylaminomethyl-2-thiouridine-forming methyltransferase MnmC
VIEKVLTNDGSYTLKHLRLNCLYRSIHGAITESNHVFIEGCKISSFVKNKLTVIELGFGGGLNFSLTCKLARELSIDLEYHAIEYEPIKAEFLTVVNLESEIIAQEALHSVNKIRNVTLAKSMDGLIKLYLYPFKLNELIKFPILADAIYHDPFGPLINPESWNKETFIWHAKHLKLTGALATYSSARIVKDNLVKSGLVPTIHRGPLGKRDIIFASHPLLTV